MPRVSLSPGRVIAERYRLVAPLAEGGMGSVWRAEHLTLGHAVAMKFLAGGIAASVEHRSRFEREARVAARIAEDSRHVVKVTDHGIDDDGTPYLVMELLHGEALNKRLQREPHLPVAVVAEIVRQIARGLEVAHRHGVVHRDLKPANVFLCDDLSIDDVSRGVAEDINAKILDFGVAKSVWDDDAPTHESVVLGTPGYMSPEQLEGNRDIDVRTDVWALGAIAYRMLTGKLAFGTGTTAEIAARIHSINPPAPSLVVPAVPPEVDEVIARALSKSAADRYATALELGEALARAAASAIPTALRTTNDGVVAVRPAGESSHRRVVAVALLLVVIVLLLMRWSRRPSETVIDRHPAAVASEPTMSAAKPTVFEPALVAPERAVVDSTSKPLPPAVAPSIVTTASVSASASVKQVKKVIDTWHKKDEL